MIVEKMHSHELLKPLIIHDAFNLNSSRRWPKAKCDIIGLSENWDIKWKIPELEKEFLELFQKHYDDDITSYNYWINKYPPGGFQEAHVHEDCISSFIYFVDLPPHSGDLIFNGYIHNAIEGTIFFFDPKEPHHVTENKSTKYRISVAGNIK